MAKTAIDFSAPAEELLGGGGGLINAGYYRVVQSHFMFSKLGEKATREALVLFQKLQPVDKDGEDAGDEIERRWTTNETLQNGDVVLEPINPIKGRKGCYSGLTYTDKNTHQRIYKLSEFGVLLEHMKKNTIDMDEIGNDWTAMEDKIYEYGLYTWPERTKSPVEKAEDDEDDEKGAGKKKFNGPKQTIIIVSEFDGKAKKSTKKKKEDDDDDEDEKPAKTKGKSSKKNDEPETAEEFLAKYLEEEVCTSENEDDGAGHPDHKLSIPKWLNKQGCDDKMKKAVMGIYNNVEDEDGNEFFAILEKLGWEYKAKKKLIVKKDE